MKFQLLHFLHKFDIFAFSETWLNSNIPNDSILIPGYNAPLRKDRTTSHGGRVALHVFNFNNVDVAGLDAALSAVNWDSAFNDHKEIVCIFNEFCLNPSLMSLFQLNM